MPACFGASGSVRHEAEHEVGALRVARPDLLAVDHPLVAVELGARAERGEVAARAGLAVALAPERSRRATVARDPLLLLPLGAALEQRRHEHHGADAARVAGRAGARRTPRGSPARRAGPGACSEPPYCLRDRARRGSPPRWRGAGRRATRSASGELGLVGPRRPARGQERAHLARAAPRTVRRSSGPSPVRPFLGSRGPRSGTAEGSNQSARPRSPGAAAPRSRGRGAPARREREPPAWSCTRPAAERGARGEGRPVEVVADDRGARGGELDAELVGAPGRPAPRASERAAAARASVRKRETLGRTAASDDAEARPRGVGYAHERGRRRRTRRPRAPARRGRGSASRRGGRRRRAELARGAGVAREERDAARLPVEAVRGARGPARRAARAARPRARGAGSRACPACRARRASAPRRGPRPRAGGRPRIEGHGLRLALEDVAADRSAPAAISAARAPRGAAGGRDVDPAVVERAREAVRRRRRARARRPRKRRAEACARRASRAAGPAGRSARPSDRARRAHGACAAARRSPSASPISRLRRREDLLGEPAADLVALGRDEGVERCAGVSIGRRRGSAAPPPRARPRAVDAQLLHRLRRAARSRCAG